MTWTSVMPLIFVPIFFIAAWALPHRFQLTAIAGVGIIFLLLASPYSVAILLSLGILSFYLTPVTKFSGIGLLLALLCIIIILFVFLKSRVTLGESDLSQVYALGFAFYSLRIINYFVEDRTGKLSRHTLSEYLKYLFFFPTINAGPVNLFSTYLRDSKRRRWDISNLSFGLGRIIHGYFKIVVLANYFVQRELEIQMALIGTDSWLGAYLYCLSYGLNLYFQFSGYSDVAIGIGRIAGFTIPENFRYPFLSCNIRDFWKRWHISVTDWFRKHLFYPLISYTRSFSLSAVVVMICLGFWHELSWRYLIWGAYHGFGIAIFQIYRNFIGSKITFSNKWVHGLQTVISWFITFNFVILSFAITRATDINETWRILRTIITLNGL